MSANNSEQFLYDNPETKAEARNIEPAIEKLKHPESFLSKIDLHLNKLKQLEGASHADTKEALAMIAGAEDGLQSSLPEEMEAATTEINRLDDQKNRLLVSSESALQGERATATAVESPWANIDQSDLKLRESLRQEKESLRLRELKTLAAVAYTKIKDHADSLGLEIGSAPEDRISFKNKGSRSLGIYSTDSDDIKVESNSAKVIIHEELHFAGAVDNRSAKKNLGDNRISKTGFKSVWKSREAEEPDKDLLRSLNEAVTEKMAREIFQKNKEAIIADVIKADPEIAQLNDKLAEQEKSLALSDVERYLPDKYKAYQENVFIQEYAMDSQSFEELSAEEQQKIESKFKAELFESRSQEMLKDTESYSSEITVLDAMLDRLSQARAGQENIGLDAARTEEWKDMQRAYLKGETIYLRRIEKIVGPNFLREFNDIDIRKVNNEEETREEYQQKISNLINRINS